MTEIKEINYGQHLHTGSAPVIKKLGVMAYAGESTPFVWNGKLMNLQNIAVAEAGNSEPLDSSNLRYGGQIRDIEANTVGEPFALGHYLLSGYEENGTMYVFCVNRWGGDTVLRFTSTDLIHWERKELFRREGWEYYNTTVCKGRDGRYVMAIEAGGPREIVGRPFTTFFLTSDDLLHWTPMPDEIRYDDGRYTACPALRYIPEDDYYYMICLEELPNLRYAPYIYRTRDFITWEIGYHNPVLWIGPEDHRIMEGCVFPKEIEEDIKTYHNINNCDLDLCEFEGKTYITYGTGDQLGQSYCCLAVYDGTLTAFCQHFFNAL